MRPPSTTEWPAVKASLIQHEHNAFAEQPDKEPSQQARVLRRSISDLLLLSCGDVLAILLWFAMLLYASLLWHSHGKKEVDLRDQTFNAQLLMDFARPLSTVFTILFAATTGRAVKSFAIWLLQQGCSIQTLDRLFGSTTVGGAVLTNSTLGVPREFNTHVLVTALLCLWTLSPLASQAVLRIMSTQAHVVPRNVSRAYMNISDWGALQGEGSDGSEFVIAPNTVLNAALIAPQSSKDSPRDLWGNVKIPLLSANTSTESHDGWQEIHYDGFTTYSSLVGLPIAMPIAGAPQTSGTSANMSVSSWYWDLDCSPKPWTSGTTDKDLYTTWAQQATFNWTSTVAKYSPPLQILVGALDLNRTGVYCNTPCNGNITTVYCSGLPPRTFNIVLRDQSTDMYGTCSLRTIYVESEILCDNAGCLASRVRALKTPDLPPPEWTVLDACYQTTENYHPLGRFFTNLVDSIQSRSDGSGGQNALAGFIADPANAFRVDIVGSSPEISDLSPDIITKRLAQVLNTYWMSSLAWNLTTGDWGENFKDFDPFAPGFYGIGGYWNNSLLQTSIATVYDEYNIFTCNLWWLTAFTVSTLIALFTSILGLVVVLRSRGPRLAMNVTTMIRDSLYVELPFVTSYMGDAERSRRTGQTRVILGDVAPSREIGHVAIAQECEEIEVDRLKRDRLYN